MKSNKDLIDDKAYRYFFVANPVKVKIDKAPSEEIELDLHPEHKKGGRKFSTTDVFHLAQDDVARFKSGELNRLMEIQKLYINCQNIYINLIDEKKNSLIIEFQRNYWEQKVSNLLNKINQFIVKLSINYEVQEQEISLVLKLKYQNKCDALNLANEVICKLSAI